MLLINNKIKTLLIFLLACLYLSLCRTNVVVVGRSSNDETQKRLNVLFLVIDDLRTSLGSYEYPQVHSPNIDQLAASSVQFENAHAQQAVCGPSRISFLTSRRPDTTRLYDFKSYWRTHAGNFTSLPQHFKENGYFTYSIGKVFHAGKASGKTDDYPYSWSKPAYHPSSEQYKMEKVCPSADGSLGMNLLCPVDVPTQPEGTLPDIQSADHAVEFLKNMSTTPSEQPFFLGVGFHKPHIPLKFPAEYLDIYPLSDIDIAPNSYMPVRMPLVAYNPWTDIRRRDDMKLLNMSFPFGPVPHETQRQIRQHYYAATTYMDAMVGKVLNQLEESGLANNTVVLFVSDHGWSMGEHGEWSKYENFDITTKVPLLLHVPGITDQLHHHHRSEKFKFKNVFQRRSTLSSKVRHKSRNLVELVDIFPTLAEVCGLSIPPTCPPHPFNVEFCTEGASFAKHLYNVVDKNKFKDTPTKTAVFSQYPRPSLFPQSNSDLPDLADIKIMGYTMRTHHHRYTEWVQFDPTTFKANFSQVYAKELYLHEGDPLEMVNVAEDSLYDKLIKSLSKRLVAGWREALIS